MRISELMQKTPLNVIKDDPNSTTLEDPNTKVKTVVPKDPKKPGMITKDPQTNKATLNTKTAGPVSTLLKPGEKVEVTEKSVVGTAKTSVIISVLDSICTAWSRRNFIQIISAAVSTFHKLKIQTL